jgi:hypothetical protein
MTKREVSWLIVRIAGLYFLWQAVEMAISVTATLGVALGEPMLMGKSVWVLLQMLFKIGFYTVLGLYCVGNGRLFFHMLSREPVG